MNLDPAGRDGVGAVRAFRTGGVVSVERLTEIVPERRMTYVDVSNPVIYDYTASIELEPHGDGGTMIRWRGRFKTRFGMGFFMSWYLQRFQQNMVDGLAAHASFI